MPKIYYGITMTKKTKTNFATANKINKLSRAINKIDPTLKSKLLFDEYRIQDIKPGINSVKYRKNGIAMEVRYDELENLSQEEKGSLSAQLKVDRYNLRQERAIEQLQTRGKVTSQFKRSLKKDNPVLLKSIEEVEDILGESKQAAIQMAFEEIDIDTDIWEEEAAQFFEYKKGQENNLYDFYRPGEDGGFTELNQFTWNAYKVLRGF
jgi:hypothetical protein